MSASPPELAEHTPETANILRWTNGTMSGPSVTTALPCTTRVTPPMTTYPIR
jgi:hypothetical protein